MVIIEQILRRKLINLYCSHHEKEVKASEVCKTVLGPTAAPYIQENKDFKEFYLCLKDDVTFPLDQEYATF